MTPVDNYIFGNEALHSRLSVTMEILGRIVSSAPHCVSIAQLAKETGRSHREVTSICRSLSRSDLLQADAKLPQHWTLARDASLVTMEDVFRHVITQHRKPAKSDVTPSASIRVVRPASLLIMQAMLGINQSIFSQFRRFSLDQLKASPNGHFHSRRRSYSKFI